MTATEAETQAKQTAYYNQLRGQAAVQGLGNSLAGAAISAPKEPTLSERLKELRGYLYELTDLQSNIRYALVGPEVTSDPRCESKDVAEPTIEQLLADCCQRAANLVGFTRTLRTRF